MDMKEHAFNIINLKNLSTMAIGHASNSIEKYLTDNFIEKPKSLEWVVGRYYKTRDGNRAILIDEDKYSEECLLFFYFYYPRLPLWAYKNGCIHKHDIRDNDIIGYWEE